MHQIKTEQVLPISLEKAWEFFSSPANLNEITPEDMRFKIIHGDLSQTYAGQIITYKVSPFPGIPMAWVTEITQCIEQKYFIDEQRFGPFKFWHHQHKFSQHKHGVLMEDILHYSLPFGFIGEIAGKLLIHKKVQGIFNYRERKLDSIFPKQ